jgi:hypothetical protein
VAVSFDVHRTAVIFLKILAAEWVGARMAM